ncbi:MAG: DegT/DnrJ/EryC1/StrS family aminotransferase [Methanothrix sp.]|nr:DegT/DnrJ/EryC1/StrS family aminotransferase [Methanothrix sp.]
MREFIPIAKPIIGQEEINAVEEVLKSGMLAQGEAVKRFEDEFAAYLGVKNAIAVNNGTVALDLAVKALGLVFADVDERTFNIDPDDLQEKITPRTRAVIGVHLYGQPFQLSAVQEICQDKNIALVEDCAQAHGAEWKGKKVGSFATGCFSFYPTKNMTTGEGGMITTDDDALAARLRLLRSHGDSGKYNHITIGYNYRMMNLQGALGLVQLRHLEQFTAKRIANARFLDDNIRVKGISTPFRMDSVRHVYHQYVVRVEDDFPASRQRLMEYLQDRGVGSAIHYPRAVYQQPVYRDMGYTDVSCPVAEDVSRRVMSLPVHPSLTADDLQYIAETMNSFEA